MSGDDNYKVELLRLAAKTLREYINPNITPYEQYRRLVHDLNWPVALAVVLDEIAEQAAAHPDLPGPQGSVLGLARAILRGTA